MYSKDQPFSRCAACESFLPSSSLGLRGAGFHSGELSAPHLKEVTLLVSSPRTIRLVRDARFYSVLCFCPGSLWLQVHIRSIVYFEFILE